MYIAIKSFFVKPLLQSSLRRLKHSTIHCRWGLRKSLILTCWVHVIFKNKPSSKPFYIVEKIKVNLQCQFNHKLNLCISDTWISRLFDCLAYETTYAYIANKRLSAEAQKEFFVKVLEQGIVGTIMWSSLIISYYSSLLVLSLF